MLHLRRVRSEPRRARCASSAEEEEELATTALDVIIGSLGELSAFADPQC